MKKQMQSRKKCVDNRVEIFVAPRRQINQRNAAISLLGIAFAAVDGYSMSARHQPRGKLLREGLESTIIRGDPARAKNRYVNL